MEANDLVWGMLQVIVWDSYQPELHSNETENLYVILTWSTKPDVLALIQICRTLEISLSEKFALKIQIQCNLKLETDGILLQVLPYSMSSLYLTMFISVCIGIYCFHAGVGVGSEFCGPESPGLRDPNIWVVTVGKLWQYGVQTVKCKHTSL